MREWDRIKEFYKPLRVPKRSSWPQYQPDEERILHEVAFSRPKWQVAAHYMMVMLSPLWGLGSSATSGEETLA